jgi:hypothetical protein
MRTYGSPQLVFPEMGCTEQHQLLSLSVIRLFVQLSATYLLDSLFSALLRTVYSYFTRLTVARLMCSNPREISTYFYLLAVQSCS